MEAGQLRRRNGDGVKNAEKVDEMVEKSALLDDEKCKNYTNKLPEFETFYIARRLQKK